MLVQKIKEYVGSAKKHILSAQVEVNKAEAELKKKEVENAEKDKIEKAAKEMIEKSILPFQAAIAWSSLAKALAEKHEIEMALNKAKKELKDFKEKTGETAKEILNGYSEVIKILQVSDIPEGENG